MPALTTTYDLNLPTVGGDAATWGGYLNTNFELLDTWLTNTFDSPSLDPTTGHLGLIKDSKIPTTLAGKTFSSAISLPAAGLGVTFTGDTNTGFGQSAADTAAIYAGSATARVTVTTTEINSTVGLSFGSTVAPGGATDVSRHLDLYGGTYGLCVTGSVLNIVSPSGSTQSFSVGGSSRFEVNGTDVRSAGSINVNGSLVAFDSTQDRASAQVAPTGIISVQGTAASGAAIAVFSVYHGANNNTMQIRRNGAIFNTTGTMGVLSDPNAKDDITAATNKLDDINRLGVINYRLKGKGREYGKLLGFDAENVSGIFPGLVEVDEETGFRVVKWSVMVPMLVKAVQELTARTRQLHERVLELEAAQ